MKENDFKKLLVDLELSITEIALAVGISSWAVTLYFRDVLKAAETRRAIRNVLSHRAQRKGIRLPDFWSQAA